MITADLKHSFSKILPAPQQITPVSLKRKLNYSGYYIEEWIDSEKISLYFCWLKENNPLFKDIDFNLESLETQANEIAENIEYYLTYEKEKLEDEVVPEEFSEEDQENESLIRTTVFPDLEPLLMKEDNKTVGHDSILLNKYEVEIEDSPMEKYSNIIIDWEIYNGIENEYVDDLNDELVEVKDEILEEEHEELYSSVTDSEKILTPDLAKQVASNCVKKVKKKVEKISIAPGEHGKFKNWGDDIYLEVSI